MAIVLFAAALVAQSDADVVATAKRLRDLRVELKTDRATKSVHCVFKRPSGDPELDRGVCEALTICARTARTKPEMQACLQPHIQTLLPLARLDRGGK